MACNKCRRPAIVYQRYSGLHLCEPHFNEDFEKKAKRGIRKHRWIHPGDRIGVCMNGGAGSNGLAFFLAHLLKKRQDIDLIGLSVVEGFASDQGAIRAKEVARTLGISWVSASLADEIGFPTGNVATKAGDRLPCSHCDVLMNHCLEHLAREQGVTKIALSKDLDDEAGEILTSILQGPPYSLYYTSAGRGCKFPRILPFISIPKREVLLYAFLHLNCIASWKSINPPSHVPEEIQTLLNDYTYRHPATKYALINLAEEIRSSSLVREDESGRMVLSREPVSDRCEGCDIVNKVHHGN